MNRYALWKYVIIVVAVVCGVLYASPTLLRGVFGEAPVVQVSAIKSEEVNAEAVQRIQNFLRQAGIEPTNSDVLAEQAGQPRINIRFSSKEDQARARDVLIRGLNPDATNRVFAVAINTESLTPAWLKAIGAKPVNLGLDLRGGVHFLLQVDMKTALANRLESLANNIRTDLRNKSVPYESVTRNGLVIDIVFANEQALAAAEKEIRSEDAQVTENTSNGAYQLQVTLLPQAVQRIEALALQQNINTLHNRINALGVAEPLIQQQGADRIVVQLPGVEDTTEAKEILGRTATLQIRMVDESPQAMAALNGQGPVPLGSERFTDREGRPLILRREVLLTGENLNDAQPGRTQDTQIPAVFLNLDTQGSRIFYDLTRENRGKRMAIVLFEQGRGEVVTAPSINEPIPGGRVQISGSMTIKEAQSIALLLRSGSLAAPMEIIEERTIGPSLGEENIARGVNSVIYGFAIVAVFMCLYYMLFGVFSTISMAINLLLLVSVMSLLQATLTLPGIAAMALALGMAIDANVLINERIREELRAGATPQMAINAGYEHAWGTILDSNITSLIAGLALLTCDAGPIRGFAVVHCLGILTSLFTSVFVSRGLVNLWYGQRRKLKSLAIGQIWKPQQD
ncbi:protein translocase subunit SecD [Saezia sanguinis]|uniref:protein translocase subunit SecD n=1 Tax=Saezia sanguinis TaxID=1965230 RepID=UPI0030701D32